jgi:hypothetical protein
VNVEELPIDDGRWETVATAYHVRFWTLLEDATPPSAPLWECAPLRVEGVGDVCDVLDWARENAAGRSYTIYVEVDGDPGGVVQIYGVDPTVAPEARSEQPSYRRLSKDAS